MLDPSFDLIRMFIPVFCFLVFMLWVVVVEEIALTFSLPLQETKKDLLHIRNAVFEVPVSFNPVLKGVNISMGEFLQYAAKMHVGPGFKSDLAMYRLLKAHEERSIPGEFEQDEITGCWNLIDKKRELRPPLPPL